MKKSFEELNHLSAEDHKEFIKSRYAILSGVMNEISSSLIGGLNPVDSAILICGIVIETATRQKDPVAFADFISSTSIDSVRSIVKRTAKKRAEDAKKQNT